MVVRLDNAFGGDGAMWRRCSIRNAGMAANAHLTMKTTIETNGI